MDRKQVLFFDGIRHAAELAEHAHLQLVKSLTILATAHHGTRASGSFTEPFLYAWAVVDAVDRLRALVGLLPGARRVQLPDGRPGFLEKTQVIRDLRNVADHVAERADYVIARDGTALGILSWFTLIDETHGVACTILPGTLANRSASFPNPLGKKLTPPTDLITLAAGEYAGSLSDAILDVRQAVTYLESSLESALRERGLDSARGVSDLLLTVQMEFGEQRPPSAGGESAQSQ